MADLILSVYENKYPEKVSRRKGLYWGSVAVLTLLSGLLICNLRYGKSTELQIILSILSMGTVVYIFIYYFLGKEKYKKSVEDFSEKMEQMESVLYQLDIDTYTKLELVIDEVRDRVESEARNHGCCHVISSIVIVTVAASVTLFLFRSRSVETPTQIGSITSLFLILAALMFYILYGCEDMHWQGWKYCWLLNMLLNVKIVKF